MIKEVAIEPEVMATWQHFRDLWDDLGVGRGRLVAEYPEKWREIVCKLALSRSSTKAAKIFACLKPGPGMGGARRWVPTTRPFPNRNPGEAGLWLKNAESHNPPDDFDAIIAAENPRGARNVLVAGDYLKSHATWAVPSQKEIPRTAIKLLECADFLLRVSNELILVEPNFDANEARFLAPFEALVNCRASGGVWKRLELHTKFPTDRDGKPFPAALPNRTQKMQQALAPLIPTGNTLNVFFWQRKAGGKRIHPRYILTDLGGLQPDYGLDEGDAIGDTTIVALMDETVWETVRGDHCAASQTFLSSPGWQVPIAGTK